MDLIRINGFSRPISEHTTANPCQSAVVNLIRSLSKFGEKVKSAEKIEITERENSVEPVKVFSSI